MRQIVEQSKDFINGRIRRRGTSSAIAVMLAGLVWTPAAVLAQLPSGNLVQDAGFEPGTLLQPFARAPGNPWIPGEWNAESANVINGSIAGISPQTNNGMLRMNAAGGNSSQVNQIIDVSSFATDIDAGNTVVRFSIWMNAPAANVSPALYLQAGESQNPAVGVLVPVGGSFTTGYNRSILVAALDGDPATWEKLEGAMALPSGTRFLELQFFESVASVPPDGVFFDTVSVVLASCEALLDSGFDSGSAPLQPFARGPGDPPWTPGEWNAENADLIVGPSAGISPWFGDGMLRVNTSFSYSQVNQIVDVSGFANAIDNGGVTARISSWFNAAVGGAQPRIFLLAGESQNANGTLVPVGGSLVTGFNQRLLATTADADPGTWEAIGSVFGLPSGTRFLRYELQTPGATSPPTGVFFDAASLCLRAALPSFGLSHTALGLAQLGIDAGSGNLIIDNIGSSGEDGVSVNAGAAHFLRLDFPDLASAPIGAAFSFAGDGTVNGEPGQTVGALDLTKEAEGQWRVQPDFSAIGASNVQFQVYQDGDLVGIIPSTAGAFVQVLGTPGSVGGGADEPGSVPNIGNIGCICDDQRLAIFQCCGNVLCDDPQDPLVSWVDFCGGSPFEAPYLDLSYYCSAQNGLVVFDRCSDSWWYHIGIGDQGSATASFPVISADGQHSYMGDSVMVFVLDEIDVSQPISNLSVTAVDSSFAIGQASLGALGGFAHSALNDVRLNAGSGQLTIDNIGACGEDGVAISTGSAESFNVNWNLLDSGSIPDGAFLEFNGVGSVGGTAGQALGSLRVTDVGSEYEITADYSPIGSTSQQLEVLNGGVVVATVTGHTGAVARVPDWPKGCGKGRAIIDDFSTACYSPCWPVPVSIQIIGGPTVMGDAIRVLAENPTAEFDFLSEFSVQAADIPQIVLNDESMTAICDSDGDLDNDGDVDLVDYKIFAECVDGPDITSSGIDCGCFDFDNDSDTDLRDFASFQVLFAGP